MADSRLLQIPERRGHPSHVPSAGRRRVQTFTSSGCAPWVVANAGAAGYYLHGDRLGRRANGSRRSRPALGAGTRPVTTDVWAAVRAVDFRRRRLFPRWHRRCASDSASTVVGPVVGPVQFVGGYLVTDESARAVPCWVQRTFAAAYRDLGRTPAAGEPDDRRARRAAIISVLGDTGGDTEVRDRAGVSSTAISMGTTTIDPTLLDTVTTLAALDGDAALYERYVARSRAAAAPEDRDRFLHGLARFTDSGARPAAQIELTLSAQVRTQDAACAGRDCALGAEPGEPTRGRWFATGGTICRRRSTRSSG